MFEKFKNIIADTARRSKAQKKLVTALFQPAIDSGWGYSDKTKQDYSERIRKHIGGESKDPHALLVDVEMLAEFYANYDCSPVLSVALYSAWDVFQFSAQRLSEPYFRKDKHLKRTVDSIITILASTAINFADGTPSRWRSMYKVEDYERATEYGLKSLAELNAKIIKQDLKQAEWAERESIHHAELQKRIESETD